MTRVLDAAAFGEIATGIALVIVPSSVGQLLLGETLTGLAVPTARVAGIALIALGIACWKSGFLGMLVYSTAVAIYLAYVGLVQGLATGVLLWPAVAVHAVLSALLWRNRFKAE